MIDVKPTVTHLRRIIMVVADLDRSEHVFAEAFAFETVERRREDAGFSRLLGVPHAEISQTIMRLGEQEIGLLAFDPPGRVYPADSTSTDLWFQHFAIIVSDMEAAYRRLQAVGRFTPISLDGPQRLPPRSGSVTAFKFRDEDGHPLELLAFPDGEAPPYWAAKMTSSAAASSVWLGIDHSALAVADTDASIAFYQTCLGLRLGAQTRNEGPEQARLDAVDAAEVTVTGLDPAERAVPHVELLGYHVGTRRAVAARTSAADRVATMLVLQTETLSEIVAALSAAKATFLSDGIVDLASGERAILVTDPDGHRIMVVQ